MKKPPVIVSICCITYNHEKYISKCIEGFLMQKTNLKFEILIHDDASTDNTQSIIKEYTDSNKELFITVLQKENQMSQGVRVIREFLLPKAKGKYIAICEGDDFWTDSYKLQKQVDFLEANPSYGLVCTDYDRLIDKTGELIKCHNINIKREVPIGDIYNNLLIENTIATLTVLYRKKLLEENKSSPFLTGKKKYKMGDYPNWLVISQSSKIGYLKESTATYRVLENSASHFTDKAKKYDFLMSEFQVKFDFIEAYGCNEEVKEEILKEYYIRKVEYGYFMRDFKMIKENYTKLTEVSTPSLKTKLHWVSSFSNFHWYLINNIFKIKKTLLN